MIWLVVFFLSAIDDLANILHSRSMLYISDSPSYFRHPGQLGRPSLPREVKRLALQGSRISLASHQPSQFSVPAVRKDRRKFHVWEVLG
jgi:hypothetical protein